MKALSDDELLEELKRRLSINHKTIKDCNDLIKQLVFTNKKLEESEKVISHFISNVTNEIINPFASILGLSNNIVLSKPNDIDKIKSMATLINSEAFNLDFQLNNIFIAAKLEAGEAIVDIYNVNIKDLVNSIIDSFKNEIKKKKLIINTEFLGAFKKNTNPNFKTDPNKVRVIIINLLSNAIKFSNDASEIEIKCSIDDDLFTISVKDHGIDIDKKDQKIIFDRFKRLDNSINDKNRGHGLGLSVSKSLLDILNGKIDVMSDNKLGTTFIATIPDNNSNNEIGDFSNTGNDFLFNDKEKF